MIRREPACKKCVQRVPAPTKKAVTVFNDGSETDVLGSYTGKPKNKKDLPVQDADRRVCAGDVLSVRGYGKFIIDRCEDETRRGRIRLEARKYI